jgi:hypothetical protein
MPCYTDDVNILGKIVDVIKKVQRLYNWLIRGLSGGKCKEKTKDVFMSCSQNIDQNHNVLIAVKSLGMTVKKIIIAFVTK